MFQVWARQRSIADNIVYDRRQQNEGEKKKERKKRLEINRRNCKMKETPSSSPSSSSSSSSSNEMKSRFGEIAIMQISVRARFVYLFFAISLSALFFQLQAQDKLMLVNVQAYGPLSA